MGFALAPTAIAAGYSLEVHETVMSTNTTALERAAGGAPSGLWVVSANQQGGKGRRGRPWVTPPGNLSSSLMLRPLVPLKAAASLGFVAGLSLADALDAVVPAGRISIGVDGGSVAGSGRFELKWPNDVLAHGAKLSGILLESVILDGDRYGLVIGIGVNVVSSPQGTPYPATSLKALGADCDAEALFLALSDAWVENGRIWDDGRGLDAIRRKWLDRAAGLGAQVAVRADGRVIRGIFETIDEECRFVIRENDGNITRIAAGDVHFGAVASADHCGKEGA